jgi:hypothetical protein
VCDRFLTRCTQPRSLEVYRFLGLIDDIMAEARPTPPLRLHERGTMKVLKEWYMFEKNDPTPDCPYVSEPEFL